MKLRYVLMIIAVAFALVIFAPPQAEKELTPQDAMGNLARNAGYDIGGYPQFNGNRWTMYSRVPGCRAHVMLVSDTTGLAELIPKKVLVSEVGDVPLGKINMDLDGSQTAKELREIPEVKKYLQC